MLRVVKERGKQYIVLIDLHHGGKTISYSKEKINDQDNIVVYICGEVLLG